MRTLDTSFLLTIVGSLSTSSWTLQYVLIFMTSSNSIYRSISTFINTSHTVRPIQLHIVSIPILRWSIPIVARFHWQVRSFLNLLLVRMVLVFRYWWFIHILLIAVIIRIDTIVLIGRLSLAIFDFDVHIAFTILVLDKFGLVRLIIRLLLRPNISRHHSLSFNLLFISIFLLLIIIFALWQLYSSKVPRHNNSL